MLDVKRGNNIRNLKYRKSLQKFMINKTFFSLFLSPVAFLFFLSLSFCLSIYLCWMLDVTVLVLSIMYLHQIGLNMYTCLFIFLAFPYNGKQIYYSYNHMYIHKTERQKKRILFLYVHTMCQIIASYYRQLSAVIKIKKN